MTVPRSLSGELQALTSELQYTEELAQDAPLWMRAAPAVSSWSVGDQVEHLVRVDEAILRWLDRAARGEETAKQGRPTAVGYFILLTGIVPRGRGRAPDWTHPERVDREAVCARLATVVESVGALQENPGALPTTRATQRHPLLGWLSGYQWVRFARVHHRHHRKIIADILTKSR